MTNLIGRTLHRLGEELGAVCRCRAMTATAAATAIWAKPVGPMPAPSFIADTEDVSRPFVLHAAATSIVGARGGHDLGGRALCGASSST